MPNDELTVLVVGAGAVENAWAPVLRALRHYHDFPLTDDGANSFLARLVYLLRWHATFPDPEAKRRLVGFEEYYRDVCQRIREEVRTAQQQGELRVRPEFGAVIDRLLVKRTSRFAVINTNWDTTVEDALSTTFRDRLGVTIDASHIHGTVAGSDPLYLPSEVTREPYRHPDEHNLIGGLHAGAMRALDRAQNVVLYGLSLSPLDAELCQTLESGWDSDDLECIDVVVPNHELVAHRVNLLVNPERHVSVRGFDPRALDSIIDYTVSRSVRSDIADRMPNER